MPHGGFDEEAAVCGGGYRGLILAVVSLAVADLRHPNMGRRMAALRWLREAGCYWAEAAGVDPQRLGDLASEVRAGKRRVRMRRTEGR